MKKKISLRESMEQLKFENELEKIKLNLEHGAEFIDLTEHGIPAEVERDFLKQVEQFESAHGNCKRIQIYDFIGRPDFKVPSEIKKEDICKELEEVRDVLMQHQICIDTICDVADFELYRFIVEELFFEEVDDIRMDHMFQWFIYEEFHPNHDYDIRNSCTNFIEGLFNKQLVFNPDYLGLSDELITKDGIVKQKGFVGKLNEFRDSYSVMQLNELEINSVLIGDCISKVSFVMEFSLTMEGTDEQKNISGTGEIDFRFEAEYWNIICVSIPGIAL